PHLAAQQVYFEVTHLEFGDFVGTFPHRTTGDGFETGDQLGEGEGLADVIVGACTQSLDLVVDLAEGTQDQGGRTNVGCTQRADDRESVHFGQHPVDDQDVEVARGGHQQAVPAASRVLDTVARLAESADDERGHSRVVFNHQYSHMRIITCWNTKSPVQKERAGQIALAGPAQTP